MTLQDFTNAITVLCGITATVFAIKIYLLTRSTAVLWLVAATTYITIARILISISQAHPYNSHLQYFDAHSSFIIFLYWPVKAVAVVLLYLSLKELLYPTDYNGEDRRKPK